MIDWLIDWLNFTACQHVQSDVMPRTYGDLFTVRSYLHFEISCFYFMFYSRSNRIRIILNISRLEKKLDGNYTRMLRAILNKSWRQHPTRRQLYGHLPPITKTIEVRRARHAGHCWRSKDELVSDVLLWTPTYGQAKAGRPARTYIQQLCEDTGCNPEDLPEVMNDRKKWREMVKDICAGGMTWWWWWWW